MPFLKAAVESETALHDLTEVLIAEITTVLFCTGNTNLSKLKHSNSLQVTGDRGQVTGDRGAGGEKYTNEY
jgi:isopentenyl diphosphate isomerase/L-lactate dehydrogenase-like FMN-dependent dehydrogenase